VKHPPPSIVRGSPPSPSCVGRVAGTVALIVVLVAGCGSTTRATPASTITLGSTGSTTPGSTTSESATAGRCTTASTQDEISVTFYGRGESACTEWNQSEAKAEQYWRTIAEAPRGKPVCSMSRGPLIIEVRQGGLTEQGNRICARSLADGWKEVEGPGERVEREKAQRKAEREHREGVEQNEQDEREAAKRQKEQQKLEKEEAAQKRQEGVEHAKEAQERAKEGQERRQEVERAHQEVQPPEALQHRQELQQPEGLQPREELQHE
jgi:hypothetical protein